MIIFEFFSGIGGMHQATYDLPDFKIKNIYPFDINPNANITYQHNFGVKPFAITIEGFTLEDYEKCIKKQEDINNSKIIWTMSPPCQPFTRQGNEKDLNDPRTKGFTHLMNILENTKYPPNYFFLENVKNFEYSNACGLLKKTLFSRNYKFNQFLLSPNQIGVPNSRSRYYLLARDSQEKEFIFKEEEEIITSPEIFVKLNLLKQEDLTPASLGKIFDFSDHKKDFLIDEKILSNESSSSIDIVTFESNQTCCFTKGYSKLLKGSGSVLLLDQSLYKVNTPLIFSKILI
jgi:tRNA (cytosine38-C5)-methyltransferase